MIVSVCQNGVVSFKSYIQSYPSYRCFIYYSDSHTCVWCFDYSKNYSIITFGSKIFILTKAVVIKPLLWFQNVHFNRSRSYLTYSLALKSAF
jgi:hypothetical protein